MQIGEQGKLGAEELYAAHAQSAVRLAYLLVGDREAAQDIAQEAFLRAFGRFADLRRPKSFPNYLKATIVNLTRKHFRRRSLEGYMSNDSEPPFPIMVVDAVTGEASKVADGPATAAIWVDEHTLLIDR